jgi:bifunctional UDP-N-acetylglucosamine pyrophosphorylase/glucosamine-1-phosphate N-acetyltransferase/UDP-N-acetylglucosamine pyrophosphorylase
MTDAGNLPPHAIILAAGKGKRMNSTEDLPKVLYEVAGEPMLLWVVRACREAGVERCVLVVGYKSDLVRQILAGEPDCEFVEQTEQLGTGHATQMAAPLFEDGPARDVYVLAGDGPLIQAKTLARLLEVHRRTRAAATLATAIIDDPTGYGRIVREADRSFRGIVEHKDASEEELAIREVNPSYYCFRSDLLFETLKHVKNDNRQGEYYVTPVPTLLKEQGHTVSVIEAVPAADVLSINTPEQHAEVDAILRQRLARAVG